MTAELPTTTRFCPQCRAELPENAPALQEYCTPHCAEVAENRCASGQEESDSRHSDDALIELLNRQALEIMELRERSAGAEPGQGGLCRQCQSATQEPALTMATQIYQVFYALLGRYKRDRAGVRLEDYDYMLYEHGRDFAGRKKMNTTELDTRTLYYFGMLTKAAVGKAEDTNFQDHQTKNAIRLYNEVVKHVKIPTNIPARLQRVELPAQGVDKVYL